MNMKSITLTIILAFSLLIGNTQTPNYVPQNNLIAWYPFNGNTNDESGNGNHGTNYGATLANDRFGNGNAAYEFDGVDNHINSVIGGVDQLSFSMWYKSDSPVTPYPQMFYIDEIQFCRQQGNHSLYISNGTVGAIGSYPGPIDSDPNCIPDFTNWHHLVVTHDYIEGNHSIYINGELCVTTTVNTPLGFNNGDLYIGSTSTGMIAPGGAAFKGEIDDIGIWNRALTPCEINQLYESQLLDNQESISEASCESYDWNGQTYTSSGIYPQSFTNQYGCDSTVTLDLTIDSIDNTVEQNNLLLTSNQNNAAYQWINCENNTPIQGATDISLQVEENGSYAVAIENGSCQDTSDCIVIENVGVNEVDINHITIYPNPTKDQFTVKINDAESYELKVYDLKGQLLQNDFLTGTNTINLNTYESGVYLIHISNNTYNKHFKLIVE